MHREAVKDLPSIQPAVEQIQAALRQDRAAREAVSAWCLQHAFRFAYLDLAGTPNREELAEEIASKASLRALVHLDQFDLCRPFGPWLHQIARNCVRDHFRRNDHAGVPQPVYQRWVHDFLVAQSADLEALVQGELTQEPLTARLLLSHRLAADLREKSYSQFMRLVYEGPANVVLSVVKEWLRSHAGLQWAPLYEQNDAGDWVAADLPGADETEETVLAHELTHRVNEHLTELPPLCRRLLRWYFLAGLRAPEIARLEQVHPRTIYRRVQSCSDAFRDCLLQDDYFSDLTGKDETAANPDR